ncbi:DUF378 domain-containing protein [Paenibacillus sp. L3-i20]|uniref:DUF378 domain-containing protein n=1 Tax=Paenibacillus sp. L3-i20 TaxID=2905833 RepID=UPI001EE04F48|nr:DUF378 domain-containing protein [Paenibacillus sp. L3-i20]GKU78046.1 DUF378 domain-containing protein [Paenibacillus sp. L3-i20]
MKAINSIALILVILGGLNWLSVGLFNYDVVSEVFGSTDEVGARIVYIVVGLAALFSLSLLPKQCSKE